MPALPWTSHQKVAADTECTAMASRLPLRSYWHIPQFLMLTMRIRRQLAGTPGLVGYALDARLLGKTFWTVSAWTGRDALDAFSHADPHRSGVATVRPAMLPTTFVFWSCVAEDLPVSWDEVHRRVATEQPE